MSGWKDEASTQDAGNMGSLLIKLNNNKNYPREGGGGGMHAMTTVSSGGHPEHNS